MRIITFLFLFVHSVAFTQEHSDKQIKDSISYYLSNAKGQNSLTYPTRAIFLSKSIESDSLLKISSKKLGYNGFDWQSIDALEKANTHLKDLFTRNKDSSALAKFFHFKALVFRIENTLDSSYYYYHKSKDLSLILGEDKEAGIRLKSMGDMQISEKDYVGAQPTLISALRLMEPLEEWTYVTDIYHLIGTALTELDEFEEARKYYQEALRTKDKIESDSRREKWTLNLINIQGYNYFCEGKYAQALSFMNQGLSHPEVQTEYRYLYKTMLETAASCKYNLGKTKEAFDDFKIILKLRLKEDSPYSISRTHFNISGYYYQDGNKSKALYHLKQSYLLSSETNYNFVKELALESLTRLTSGEESKRYFDEYVGLRDSLEARSSNLKRQFALVRYETDKKDQENEALKIEAENERQQKLISWLISLAILLGFGLSINFFRTRRKKLIYQSQLQKAAAREEERQQIAKSLHDEVAGDLRILHQKLAKTDLGNEAQNIEKIKNNVRNLSHQLSSVSFDEVSFKDQIINLISDHFSMDFKIKTKGIDHVNWKEINDTIKRTLYLSIRESLQNTIKYAKASEFLIEFSVDKKEILLLLKDNGGGFNPNSKKTGIGLKNLKERVEEIQGSFHIESSSEGTLTTLKIPMNGK